VGVMRSMGIEVRAKLVCGTHPTVFNLECNDLIF
jgi:hypothetical protein